MRSSLVIKASHGQLQSRNSPGFDTIILRHSRILGAAVLNKIYTKNNKKSPYQCYTYLSYKYL